MDKIERYRQIIQQIVAHHAEYTPSHGQIDTLPVCDTRHDNYLLLDIGWDQTGRVYSVIFHLSLRDGKVWIERDGIEDGITQMLLDAGVPKEDIVLGFYRPERRAITEFSVA